MLISEIKTINDLYKAEDVYDNPYTAICNICLIEKPITKEYWYPSVIKYILSDKTFYPYRCKKCIKNYNNQKSNKFHSSQEHTDTE